MFRHVMLVRHAMPIVFPDRPPGSWRLGAEGMAQASDLARTVALQSPDLIVTSTEPKAIETGGTIAAGLHLACSSFEGFHEQGADSVPFVDDRDEFRKIVKRHFELADRAILGSEPSRDAARRFRTALDLLSIRFPEVRLPLIVSHGRIMAAFLGGLTGQDPWDIWKELTFPDLIRVDLNARRFEQPH